MELEYDSGSNTLRLTPTTAEPAIPPARTTTLDAILDIGEAGRLVGVEFPADKPSLSFWQHAQVTHTNDGRAYIQITPGDSGNVRSTTLKLTAEYDDSDHLIALAIPRRGDGYEITYPSGNQ